MNKVESKKIYQFCDGLLFDVDDNRKVWFICPEHKLTMTAEKLTHFPQDGFRLVCPMCETKYDEVLANRSFPNLLYEDLQNRALSLFDRDIYKNAKLIRLDDYYIPELKQEVDMKNSPYFMKVELKTDKDGDTIVVIYVGHKGDKNKVQFFIKPEKLGLSHDYKDLDPAKILSKIELTLKNRTITETYD